MRELGLDPPGYQFVKGRGGVAGSLNTWRSRVGVYGAIRAGFRPPPTPQNTEILLK